MSFEKRGVFIVLHVFLCNTDPRFLRSQQNVRPNLVEILTWKFVVIQQAKRQWNNRSVNRSNDKPLWPRFKTEYIKNFKCQITPLKIPKRQRWHIFSPEIFSIRQVVESLLNKIYLWFSPSHIRSSLERNVSFKIIKYLFLKLKLAYLWNPRVLQETFASTIPKPSSQTVPHSPLRYT